MLPQPLCGALFRCIIAFFEFFSSALSLHTKKSEEVKITQGINHRLPVFSLKEHILCSTTNRPFHYSTAARLIKEDKQELQAATCSVFILQSFFRYSLKHTNSEMTLCLAWRNSHHIPQTAFFQPDLAISTQLGCNWGATLALKSLQY